MAAGDVVMYSNHKLRKMNGDSIVDYDDGSVKMMLLTSNFTPAPLTEVFLSEIEADEVTPGTSYLAGGPALANPSVALVAGNSVFDADDETIAVDASGFTNAIWFVFYYDTGNSATSELLAYGDYGTAKSIIDSALVTQWDAAGIIEW